MNKVKIYTASPTDMSPPVDDKSFCVDFVLAADYSALKAERDQLSAQLADVVAENAALNQVRDMVIFIRDEDYDACPAKVQEVIRKLAVLRTPATDRFLAEQREQAWTEGSEPKEFGRYWVRYETDVGPQYCSAQWMEYNFCASSDTNIHKIWLADHSRSINSLKGVTHYTKLPDAMESTHLRNEVKV